MKRNINSFVNGIFRSRRRTKAIARMLLLVMAFNAAFTAIILGAQSSSAIGEDEQAVLLCGYDYEHEHGQGCYERVFTCGLEEGEGGHTHGDECIGEVTRSLVCEEEEIEGHEHNKENCGYDIVPYLACEEDDSEGHIHNEDCYGTQEVYLCEEEEVEGHEHSDECYIERTEYICGLEAGEGGHTHDADCWETDWDNLVCEILQHTHTDDCYLHQVDPETVGPMLVRGGMAFALESSDPTINSIVTHELTIKLGGKTIYTTTGGVPSTISDPIDVTPNSVLSFDLKWTVTDKRYIIQEGDTLVFPLLSIENKDYLDLLPPFTRIPLKINGVQVGTGNFEWVDGEDESDPDVLQYTVTFNANAKNLIIGGGNASGKAQFKNIEYDDSFEILFEGSWTGKFKTPEPPTDPNPGGSGSGTIGAGTWPSPPTQKKPTYDIQKILASENTVTLGSSDEKVTVYHPDYTTSNDRYYGFTWYVPFYGLQDRFDNNPEIQPTDYVIVEDTINANMKFSGFYRPSANFHERNNRFYNNNGERSNFFSVEVDLGAFKNDDIYGYSSVFTTQDINNMAISINTGYPIMFQSQFTQVDTEDEVRTTPFTYAIIVLGDGRQKLIVNIGKFGAGVDSAEGIKVNNLYEPDENRIIGQCVKMLDRFLYWYEQSQISPYDYIMAQIDKLEALLNSETESAPTYSGYDTSKKAAFADLKKLIQISLQYGDLSKTYVSAAINPECYFVNEINTDLEEYNTAAIKSFINTLDAADAAKKLAKGIDNMLSGTSDVENYNVRMNNFKSGYYAEIADNYIRGLLFHFPNMKTYFNDELTLGFSDPSKATVDQILAAVKEALYPGSDGYSKIRGHYYGCNSDGNDGKIDRNTSPLAEYLPLSTRGRPSTTYLPTDDISVSSVRLWYRTILVDESGSEFSNEVKISTKDYETDVKRFYKHKYNATIWGDIPGQVNLIKADKYANNKSAEWEYKITADTFTQIVQGIEGAKFKVYYWTDREHPNKQPITFIKSTNDGIFEYERCNPGTPGEVTVVEAGKNGILKLKTFPESIYIEELDTEGYYTGKESKEIVVSYDNNTDPEKITGSGNNVAMYDIPSGVALRKFAENGTTPLNGAIFQVWKNIGTETEKIWEPISGGFTKRMIGTGTVSTTRIAYWYNPDGLNKDLTTGYRSNYSPANVNDAGYIYIFGLPEGEYKFVETQAPYGYELPQNLAERETASFKISTDTSPILDTILINNAIPSNASTSAWTNNVPEYKFVTLTNSDKPTAPDVKLLKVGVPTDNIGAVGTPIPGIEFELVKVSTGKGKKVTTGVDGTITWSGSDIAALAAEGEGFAGNYKLFETNPPKGVNPIEPISFEIDANGNIKSVNIDQKDYGLVSYNSTAREFKIKNVIEPSVLLLTAKKTVTGTGTIPAQEFTFTLTQVNETGSEYTDGTAITQTVKLPTNGAKDYTVNFEPITGLTAGTYYFKIEEVPVSGWTCTPSSHIVTVVVDKNGTINAITGNSSTNTVSSNGLYPNLSGTYWSDMDVRLPEGPGSGKGNVNTAYSIFGVGANGEGHSDPDPNKNYSGQSFSVYEIKPNSSSSNVLYYGFCAQYELNYPDQTLTKGDSRDDTGSALAYSLATYNIGQTFNSQITLDDFNNIMGLNLKNDLEKNDKIEGDRERYRLMQLVEWVYEWCSYKQHITTNPKLEQLLPDGSSIATSYLTTNSKYIGEIISGADTTWGGKNYTTDFLKVLNVIYEMMQQYEYGKDGENGITTSLNMTFTPNLGDPSKGTITFAHDGWTPANGGVTKLSWTTDNGTATVKQNGVEIANGGLVTKDYPIDVTDISGSVVFTLVDEVKYLKANSIKGDLLTTGKSNEQPVIIGSADFVTLACELNVTGGSELEFVNTYEESIPADVEIPVWKTAEYPDTSNTSKVFAFDFNLFELTDAAVIGKIENMITATSGGTPLFTDYGFTSFSDFESSLSFKDKITVSTVYNGSTWEKTDKFEVKNLTAGTYYYVVSEDLTNDGKNGWTYDHDMVIYKVTVNPNGTKTTTSRVITVNASKEWCMGFGKTGAFKNTYTPASITIPVEKKIIGTPPGAGKTFTFNIARVDSNGVILNGSGAYSDSITIIGEGKNNFVITGLTEGEYWYKITEDRSSVPANWTYDTIEYIVRVVVTNGHAVVYYPYYDGENEIKINGGVVTAGEQTIVTPPVVNVGTAGLTHEDLNIYYFNKGTSSNSYKYSIKNKSTGAVDSKPMSFRCIYDATIGDDTNLNAIVIGAAYCIDMYNHDTDEKYEPYEDFNGFKNKYKNTYEEILWLTRNGFMSAGNRLFTNGDWRGNNNLADIIALTGVDDLTADEAYCATQFAIWHFSENITWGFDSGDYQIGDPTKPVEGTRIYDAYVALVAAATQAASSGEVISQITLGVHFEMPDSTDLVDGWYGPITVNVDLVPIDTGIDKNDVIIELTPATTGVGIYDNKNGTIKTTGYKNGDEFWVKIPQGVGTLNLVRATATLNAKVLVKDVFILNNQTPGSPPTANWGAAQAVTGIGAMERDVKLSAEATLSVNSNTDFRLQFTNKYTPPTGSLKLTKETDDGANDWEEYEEFEFTVIFDSNEVVCSDGTTGVDQGNGKWKWTIKLTTDKRSVRFDNIPIGTTYEIEEIESSVSNYKFKNITGSGTINGKKITGGIANTILIEVTYLNEHKGGPELPRTGGPGVLPFTIIGGLLIAITSCAFLYYRKLESERMKKTKKVS